MKLYNVYVNKVFKGQYKASWQGGATLQAYMEHGDELCPKTGTLGNWTAQEVCQQR